MATTAQQIARLEEEIAQLKSGAAASGSSGATSDDALDAAASSSAEDVRTGPRTSCTVRVPATSANMGPGFDCVGMALDMWSELTVTRVEDPSAPMLTITCEGEGEDELPRDETNLVVIAVKVAFEKAGLPLVPLHYHCNNRIPFGRGLGSSSAAVVSGLIAGLALCGCELKVFGEGALMRGGNQIEPEELLQLAAKIEGHPDNVCPAIYGGIQLGIQVGENQWRSCRVNCPTDLQLVAFISDSVGKTSELRSVLSDTVSRAEAVFNIGRTAFLVNALNSNKLYDLRWGTQDALHQPQRAAAVYHHLEPLIKAGLEAGKSCRVVRSVCLLTFDRAFGAECRRQSLPTIDLQGHRHLHRARTPPPFSPSPPALASPSPLPHTRPSPPLPRTTQARTGCTLAALGLRSSR